MLNAYNGCMYFRHCEETKMSIDELVVSNFNLYVNIQKIVDTILQIQIF